jgi:hypothetical protein
LLIECLETAKEAWEIKEEIITINSNKIEIEYNLNSLSLYIEHYIILI